MGILDEKLNLRPLDYPKALEMYTKLGQNFWNPYEVPMAKDVEDWHKASDAERKVIGNILKGFTLAEGVVGDNWTGRLSGEIRVAELQLLFKLFGYHESVHALSYDHLEATLGIDSYDEFKQDPVAMTKLEALFDINNNTDLALNLAVFGGAVEGVSLYSSFAILLAFNNINKFEGVGQIISWSALDEECILSGYEVLTRDGWKDVSELNTLDNIAQYDLSTDKVSFDKPIKLIEKHYDGNVVNFSNKTNKIDITVTENHDMIHKWSHNDTYQKVKAKDMVCNPKRQVPVSQCAVKDIDLCAEYKLFVALQADATVYRRSELKDTIVFALTKQRKKDKLVEILEELNIDYSERLGAKDGESIYTFLKPISDDFLSKKTSFEWALDLSAEESRAIVLETLKWDGSEWSYENRRKQNTFGQYYSTNELCVDQIQTLAIKGGLLAKPSWVVDNREEQYKDHCKLTITDATYIRTGSFEKTTTHYSGMVYCATMPKGTLIVRKPRGTAFVVGNCHSKTAIQLFHKVVEDYPEKRPSEKVVREYFDVIVNNELDFVENAFGDYDRVPAISKAEALEFVRHRANIKLEELGYSKYYYVDYDLVERISTYFDALLNGSASIDFFAVGNNGGSYTAKVQRDYHTLSRQEALEMLAYA